MSVVIVTDSAFTQALLEQMVHHHPLLQGRGIQIREAGELYGAQSKARTILTLKRQPVALVVDAETLEPRAMLERRGLLELSLEQAAVPQQWCVILLVPQAEALLFREDRLWRSVVEEVPSFEQLIRARFEPKRVLAELVSQVGTHISVPVLLQRLGQSELAPLWALAEFQQLEAFLLGKSMAPQPDALP